MSLNVKSQPLRIVFRKPWKLSESPSSLHNQQVEQDIRVQINNFQMYRDLQKNVIQHLLKAMNTGSNEEIGRHFLLFTFLANHPQTNSMLTFLPGESLESKVLLTKGKKRGQDQFSFHEESVSLQEALLWTSLRWFQHMAMILELTPSKLIEMVDKDYLSRRSSSGIYANPRFRDRWEEVKNVDTSLLGEKENRAGWVVEAQKYRARLTEWEVDKENNKDIRLILVNEDSPIVRAFDEVGLDTLSRSSGRYLVSPLPLSLSAARERVEENLKPNCTLSRSDMKTMNEMNIGSLKLPSKCTLDDTDMKNHPDLYKEIIDQLRDIPASVLLLQQVDAKLIIDYFRPEWRLVCSEKIQLWQSPWNRYVKGIYMLNRPVPGVCIPKVLNGCMILWDDRLFKLVSYRAFHSSKWPVSVLYCNLVIRWDTDEIPQPFCTWDVVPHDTHKTYCKTASTSLTPNEIRLRNSLGSLEVEDLMDTDVNKRPYQFTNPISGNNIIGSSSPHAGFLTPFGRLIVSLYNHFPKEKAILTAIDNILEGKTLGNHFLWKKIQEASLLQAKLEVMNEVTDLDYVYNVELYLSSFYFGVKQAGFRKVVTPWLEFGLDYAAMKRDHRVEFDTLQKAASFFFQSGYIPEETVDITFEDWKNEVQSSGSSASAESEIVSYEQYLMQLKDTLIGMSYADALLLPCYLPIDKEPRVSLNVLRMIEQTWRIHPRIEELKLSFQSGTPEQEAFVEYQTDIPITMTNLVEGSNAIKILISSNSFPLTKVELHYFIDFKGNQAAEQGIKDITEIFSWSSSGPYTRIPDCLITEFVNAVSTTKEWKDLGKLIDAIKNSPISVETERKTLEQEMKGALYEITSTRGEDFRGVTSDSYITSLYNLSNRNLDLLFPPLPALRQIPLHVQNSTTSFETGVWFLPNPNTSSTWPHHDKYGDYTNGLPEWKLITELLNRIYEGNKDRQLQMSGYFIPPSIQSHAASWIVGNVFTYFDSTKKESYIGQAVFPGLENYILLLWQEPYGITNLNVHYDAEASVITMTTD